MRFDYQLLWKNGWDIIWSEKFWLGANRTWDYLKTKEPGVYYPRLEELRDCLYLTVIFCLVRIVFENCVMQPLGRLFGLKDKRKLRPPGIGSQQCAFLDEIALTASKEDVLNPNFIETISKKSDLSEIQVQQYLKWRHRLNRHSLMMKFSESGWRFLFFGGIFYYGLYIMWDKPWLWDSNYCWIGHPYQNVTADIYWYYMMELAYYISCLAFTSMDVKRKDFYEMMLHHSATITLMVFSWVCNYVRVGTVILLFHDSADYWLELAKMCNYLKCNRGADVLFVVFVVVWVCTRLGLYPYVCITSVVIEAKLHDAGGYQGRMLFLVLLLILQALHIVWAYFILKFITNTYISGKKAKDSRSDSEESDEDEAVEMQRENAQ